MDLVISQRLHDLLGHIIPQNHLSDVEVSEYDHIFSRSVLPHPTAFTRRGLTLENYIRWITH